MRLIAFAPFAFAAAAFVVSPVVQAEPASPLCGSEVKKPPADGSEKPPKASTDPLCGDHVKKPSGDTEKPPKASTDPLCGDGVKKPTEGDEKPPKA